MVDITDDIDFIHITEDVGIIGGGDAFSPVCFSIRSPERWLFEPSCGSTRLAN